ncbi:hypothetical protein Hanom_Chr06g00540781 [Helianthus anomalus]
MNNLLKTFSHKSSDCLTVKPKIADMKIHHPVNVCTIGRKILTLPAHQKHHQAAFNLLHPLFSRQFVFSAIKLAKNVSKFISSNFRWRVIQIEI